MQASSGLRGGIRCQSVSSASEPVPPTLWLCCLVSWRGCLGVNSKNVRARSTRRLWRRSGSALVTSSSLLGLSFLTWAGGARGGGHTNACHAFLTIPCSRSPERIPKNLPSSSWHLKSPAVNVLVGKRYHFWQHMHIFEGYFQRTFGTTHRSSPRSCPRGVAASSATHGHGWVTLLSGQAGRAECGQSTWTPCGSFPTHTGLRSAELGLVFKAANRIRPACCQKML